MKRPSLVTEMQSVHINKAMLLLTVLRNGENLGTYQPHGSDACRKKEPIYGIDLDGSATIRVLIIEGARPHSWEW